MDIKDAIELVNKCNSGEITKLSDVAVDFFEPAYIITLASLINQGLIKKDGDIKCTEDVKTFLERVNFFKGISGSYGSCFTGKSNNLTEITIIQPEIDNEYNILSEMVHKMVIQVKDLENTQQNNEYLSRLENTLLTMIVEIIGNVVTHSKADFSQCGCMFMMQYYIWKNILHFSVIDSGVGIEETIKEAYPKPGENGAYYMSLALQQHRTANKEFGAGNGLFVCSEIVESTNSTMHIVSHKNYYEKSGQKITYDYNKSVFPGTLVNVEFNMNAIEKDISRLDDLLKRIETTEKDIEDFNYDDLR